MQYKTTTKLFHGTYQYKIVLICAGAQAFRNGVMEDTMASLQKVDITKNNSIGSNYRSTFIRTQEDLTYALALCKLLSKMNDYTLRVESPWISLYTNSKANVDKLVAIDEEHVKYISVPPVDTVLESGVVIMPKMDFDFKVTLGKTDAEQSAFVSWAEANAKLRVTKSCKQALLRSRSWGGTHFYVTGDNNLLMAKMHLGGSIAKVERIIKA